VPGHFTTLWKSQDSWRKRLRSIYTPRRRKVLNYRCRGIEARTAIETSIFTAFIWGFLLSKPASLATVFVHRYYTLLYAIMIHLYAFTRILIAISLHVVYIKTFYNAELITLCLHILVMFTSLSSHIRYGYLFWLQWSFWGNHIIKKFLSWSIPVVCMIIMYIEVRQHNFVYFKKYK
jgi:hypothetical protein